MVNIKLLGNSVIVIRFVIFLFGLIIHAKANNKIEEIENAILDYYKYTGGLIWKWNSKEAKLASIQGSSKSGAYNGLCPPGFIFDLKGDFFIQNIMLESRKCSQVPMEVLKCKCFKKTEHVGYDVTENKYFEFVRGPNGEVYEISPPENETECDDTKSMTIKRCIHRGNFAVLDVSEIEHSFLYGNGERNTLSTFYNQTLKPGLFKNTVIGAKKWKAPESTCKLLHPKSSKIRLLKLPVILESVKCAKVQMLVLKCIFDEKYEDGFIEREGLGGYVQDTDNQIYKVVYPFSDTKCKEREVHTIRKRVIDSQNKLVEHVCPM